MATDGEATHCTTDNTSEEQSDWMSSISRQFGSFDRDGRGPPPAMSSGDRAALRRMDVARQRTVEAAVVKLLVAAGIPRHQQIHDFDRWRIIAHIAAILSGTGKLVAHGRYRGLGTAMHEAGYSENRMLRLTSVRGDALHDHLDRLTRVIARKGKQPVDLWTLHDLLGSDPRQAEAARIRIAQDYYAAKAAEKGNVK